MAASSGVSVHASVAAAVGVGAPRYNVCPTFDHATCKVGSLPVGQADELQLLVSVGKSAPSHEQVKLTVKASATKSRSFSSTATVTVLAPGTGVSSIPGLTLPASVLPSIAGTGTTPGDISGLFPTVTTTPGPSSSPALGLPQVKPRTVPRAADASATVPLDARLIGGQIVGLAVLAGAVAIAIARLSLRTAKPQTAGSAIPDNGAPTSSPAPSVAPPAAEDKKPAG